MEETKEKHWWQSKMVWQGILEATGGILVIIQGIVSDLQTTIAAGTALTIFGIITIILRRITDSPIFGKGQKQIKTNK